MRYSPSSFSPLRPSQAFNVIYNVLVILILKHGSANLLYIASTVMVPINNLAFSFNFIPGHQPVRFTDLLGLLVIMFGK